jgi:hypothetical protein
VEVAIALVLFVAVSYGLSRWILRERSPEIAPK